MPRKPMVVGAVVFSLLSFGARAVDFAEPLPIKTYESSQVDSGSFKKFDEFYLPAAKRPEHNPRSADLKLTGKVWRVHLDGPKGRSSLEILANYKLALTRAGYQILFECQSEACGSSEGVSDDDFERFAYSMAQTRYLAARLSTPNGDHYVGISQTHFPTTSIVVIETAPMETGKVTVDAKVIASGLERDGHMAIYGIVFDTDKATLKPESKAALDAVADTLRKSPQLKLYVIGHTDNVGVLDHNLDLSKRRAESVLAELVGTYKIAPARLKAHGVGPYTPVASNHAEAGRAKNRRVELVEQ
jgi:OmpA-OmpF porin, OOP family